MWICSLLPSTSQTCKTAILEVRLRVTIFTVSSVIIYLPLLMLSYDAVHAIV